MTRKQLDLRTRFRLALVVAGMSQGEWAKNVGNVVPMHLSLVLNRKRTSERLLAKVEDFTAKTLRGGSSKW